MTLSPSNQTAKKHKPVGHAFYLRNPRLKAANVQIPFTQAQMQEYISCARDPLYFIKNYMKIVNVDRGLIKFEMWPFQEKMVQSFHDNRFSICKLPRQVGKSTTVCSYFLWSILFNKEYAAAIFAHKGEMARALLHKIKLAYENLPLWLQQGVVVWNKGYIELENGSNVVAIATGSAAARGSSKNAVLLDEFAFVERNQQEEFFTSVYPIIASGQTTRVIVVSTPNGLGDRFYKMWCDAEASIGVPDSDPDKRSFYVPLSIHWSDVPHYTEEWKRQTIANTSQRQFDQEFGCEFLGSGNTLIDPQYIRNMVWQKPIFEHEGLDMLEKPVQGANYAIVCDTSRGIGLDYSAFVVMDITQMPYRTVAKYRNNTVSPLLYPSVIYNTGAAYNNALVLIEINDNGQQVASILHDELAYDNVVMVAKDKKFGQSITGGYSPMGIETQQGVKTSKTVKRLGCTILKNLIENNKLQVTDAEIISECSTFVLDKDTYAAEEGCNDDLMMCLVLFAWMINQEYFKTLSDSSLRLKLYEEQMRLLEEEVSPFGLKVDGTDATEADEGRTLRVGLGKDYWNVRDDDDSMELARSGRKGKAKDHAVKDLYGPLYEKP